VYCIIVYIVMPSVRYSLYECVYPSKKLGVQNW